MSDPTVLTIVSPHGWFDVWQRPHHLASRLTRHARTAYVAPRWAKQALVRPGGWLQARRGAGPGGLLLRAPLIWNGERWIGALARLNRMATLRAVQAAHRELGAGRWILWLYDPHQVHLAEEAGADCVVYDIMDDYTAFPWSPPGIAEEEERLLARADVVLAGTRALFDSRKPKARRIHCFPSGVEMERFALPEDPTARAEARRRAREEMPWGRARHVAGYAGTLDHRMDKAGLASAARSLPDWAFVLVGPQTIAFPELEELPNVFFTGQRSYVELPLLYHSWDAGMIPFVEGPLTASLNPTKTLEYFAGGLPVVSSPIPDLLQLQGDRITYYEKDYELADALRLAVEDSEEKRQERLAEARRNSWDGIADRIWAILLETAANGAEAIEQDVGIKQDR